MTDRERYEARLARAKIAGEEAVRRFEAREAKRAENRKFWAARPHPMRYYATTQEGGS